MRENNLLPCKASFGLLDLHSAWGVLDFSMSTNFLSNARRGVSMWRLNHHWELGHHDRIIASSYYDQVKSDPTIGPCHYHALNIVPIDTTQTPRTIGTVNWPSITMLLHFPSCSTLLILNIEKYLLIGIPLMSPFNNKFLSILLGLQGRALVRTSCNTVELDFWHQQLTYS